MYPCQKILCSLELNFGILRLSKSVNHHSVLVMSLHLISMHLPSTWFKCIADMIISCNKQRPLLSSPPFTHHFLPVSSELPTIWDRPVYFGQWWRMWFQQALDLTHIFSVTTQAKPQVFFHRDWRKVWVELWELKFLNHWPFVKPEPQLRSKRKTFRS